MEERFGRYHPDTEAMHRGFRTESCFVCGMVNGDARFPENVIYEDERYLVFLDGVPYEDQQGKWTSWARGVLEIPSREMAVLANRIAARLG
jgi:hypothetical protein